MGTPENPDTGGTVWDAPNQQVVRTDQSPPWEQGTGGPGGGAGKEKPLEQMTKAELLDYADAHGVENVDDQMTKADIVAEIEAAG